MRNVLDPAIDPALRWLGHDDASIDAHQKKEKIKSISRLPGGGISAIVPGKTDFFRDPACVKVRRARLSSPPSWLSSSSGFD